MPTREGIQDGKRARTAPPERKGDDGLETEVSVAAVVKLGGAAITWKDTLETLNEPTLKACAMAIANAVKLEEERARQAGGSKDTASTISWLSGSLITSA